MAPTKWDTSHADGLFWLKLLILLIIINDIGLFKC